MADMDEGSICYDKLSLIVSNSAPYAVKAVKDLNVYFPTLNR